MNTDAYELRKTREWNKVIHTYPSISTVESMDRQSWELLKTRQWNKVIHTHPSRSMVERVKADLEPQRHYGEECERLRQEWKERNLA